MTRVHIWGCRGSLATPGPDFVRYGGNTSCVQVSAEDGTTLILDAGTGISHLGETLKGKDQAFNVLLTHMHMDHIQGMGFFSPFFNPEAKVNIWGPASTTMSLRSRLTRYLSPPLFPVTLRDLPCELTLNQVPSEQFQIGPFNISSNLVTHVGPTVGYRIECPDGVITYLPDHEPALGVKDFPVEASWTSGHALALNADLLIHDSQFSNHEYPDCIGWGHSAIGDTISFARQTHTAHLVPFHHAPGHTDEMLDKLYDGIISRESLPFEFTPAREGAVFTL